jgi:hypothetical protein
MSQKAAFALHRYHTLVLQLIQVVREVGSSDPEFRLHLARDHSIGMRGEQKLGDSKSGFDSDRGQHVGEPRHGFGRWPLHEQFNISTKLEMLSPVKSYCAGRATPVSISITRVFNRSPKLLSDTTSVPSLEIAALGAAQ